MVKKFLDVNFYFISCNDIHGIYLQFWNNILGLFATHSLTNFTMCAFQQQNRLQMGKLWPKLASGNSCKTMIVTWADSLRHPSFPSLSISTFYSPIMQPIQKMIGANKDSKWPCIHWTWWPEVESMIIFRRYAQNKFSNPFIKSNTTHEF